MITGSPSAIDSYRCRPRPSQRLGRDADVGGGEQPQVLVGRQVVEHHLDPRVARGAALEHVELALDLALDHQPRVGVVEAPKRLQHLGDRLALAQEARGIEDSVQRAPSARGPVRVAYCRSSGWIPQRTRGLSIPMRRVALLLAGGQRVDDLERALGRLDVLGRELLPDEAARGRDAGVAQRRDRLELVVLVEQRQVELVLASPGDQLLRPGSGRRRRR